MSINDLYLVIGGLVGFIIVIICILVSLVRNRRKEFKSYFIEQAKRFNSTLEGSFKLAFARLIFFSRNAENIDKQKIWEIIGKFEYICEHSKFFLSEIIFLARVTLDIMKKSSDKKLGSDWLELINLMDHSIEIRDSIDPLYQSSSSYKLFIVARDERTIVLNEQNWKKMIGELPNVPPEKLDTTTTIIKGLD